MDPDSDPFSPNPGPPAWSNLTSVVTSTLGPPASAFAPAVPHTTSRGCQRPLKAVPQPLRRTGPASLPAHSVSSQPRPLPAYKAPQALVPASLPPWGPSLPCFSQSHCASRCSAYGTALSHPRASAQAVPLPDSGLLHTSSGSDSNATSQRSHLS